MIYNSVGMILLCLVPSHRHIFDHLPREALIEQDLFPVTK